MNCHPPNRIRQHGIGVVGFLLKIPVVLIGGLVAWYGWCEGRKAYWDHKVTEMCNKDGGMHVYERVLATERYIDRYGYIRIPAKGDNERAAFEWEAKPDDLFFYQSTLEVIKSGEPTVGKSHFWIVRRADGKLLGEGVHYGRTGGDFPSFSFPSRFTCPNNQGLTALINAVFLNQQEPRGDK